VVAVGRGHKPPTALRLQVVLAHQAADPDQRDPT
jgi:hypothetical protein